MILPKDTKEWLLAAPEPYIRFQAQRLLSPKKADPTLLDRDPFIRANIKAVSRWRKEVLTRHDKPDLFIHRLAMLADLGVTRDTAGARAVIEDLLDNFAADGVFRQNIVIPQVFGGSGKATPEWIICDLPVVVYALLKMAQGDVRLRPPIKKIRGLCGESFYPCCGSIPKFKGPGPRNAMCPYANLLVARALAADSTGRRSPQAGLAARAVLNHWTHRKTQRPFLFGMGTDFLKLKLPMVWYNLLHVVSALKRIPGIAKDKRFLQMAGRLRSKLDASGRATSESIYMVYKSEEWSDKKNPSRLMTVMAHRALRGIDA
jgi:hypothetical protein